MRKTVTSILLAVLVMSLYSCDDDISSVYSTKYRVRCGFLVVSYPELVNCIDNLGQFTTIRKSGDNIVMKSSAGNSTYSLNFISYSKDFLFGLGGLIIGTPVLPSDNQPYRAYDLSCPNCDRASYRLDVSDNAHATCNHCGIVYDLNRDGMIIDKGESDFESPRVLYRYRITYDGNMVHVFN